MVYNAFKALHLAAIFVWIVTLLTTPLIAVALRQRNGDQSEALLRLRRFYAGVGAPAMLATFALGLAMAQQAGWFAAVWLQIKLALVLLLATLHGAVAGQLRRLTADPAYEPHVWLQVVPLGVVVLLVVITILAVAKPGP